MKTIIALLLVSMVSHSLSASDSLVIINQQKAIIEEFVESMIAKEFTIDNYHKYFGCNDELEFSLHKYYCQLQKINEDSCMNSFWDYNTGAIVPKESRVLFFLHNEYFQNGLDYKIKFVYSFPGWNLYELSIESQENRKVIYFRMAILAEKREYFIDILDATLLSIFTEYTFEY